MKISLEFSRLGRRLFPQDCLLCAGATSEQPICSTCFLKLPILPPGCPVCALPVHGGQICGKCLTHPPHFNRTVAAWSYDFPIDRLIHAFKFRHHLVLAPWFALSLVKRIDLGNPKIIAMPLHRKRLAERGFNQALEIARHVAILTGGSIMHSAVYKHRENLLQSELPLATRAGNVHNVFRCTEKFKGNDVIVVDDVMTTGATLNELSRILKHAGAGQVVNLVVARTLPHALLRPR